MFQKKRGIPMKRMRARRRPLWLTLSLLLLSVSWGCQMPQSDPAATGTETASSDEAERTRKMEEKAAEIERMAEEIRTMEGTELEKIDAANRLEQARRELNEMQAESGPGNL
jgi:TolA-binding protein